MFDVKWVKTCVYDCGFIPELNANRKAATKRKVHVSSFLGHNSECLNVSSLVCVPERLLQLCKCSRCSEEHVWNRGAPGSVLRAHCHAPPRRSFLRHLRHVLQPGQEGAATRCRDTSSCSSRLWNCLTRPVLCFLRGDVRALRPTGQLQLWSCCRHPGVAGHAACRCGEDSHSSQPVPLEHRRRCALHLHGVCARVCWRCTVVCRLLWGFGFKQTRSKLNSAMQ